MTELVDVSLDLPESSVDLPDEPHALSVWRTNVGKRIFVEIFYDDGSALQLVHGPNDAGATLFNSNGMPVA